MTSEPDERCLMCDAVLTDEEEFLCELCIEEEEQLLDEEVEDVRARFPDQRGAT